MVCRRDQFTALSPIPTQAGFLKMLMKKTKMTMTTLAAAAKKAIAVAAAETTTKAVGRQEAKVASMEQVAVAKRILTTKRKKIRAQSLSAIFVFLAPRTQTGRIAAAAGDVSNSNCLF